ncbi:hypothetical protein [Nitrosopumilus sp. S6]
MKNLATFAFLAFALTGLLTVSVIPGSFADTENPGRDKGTKTANGCDKGTAKNNPNCDGTSTGGGFSDCDNITVDNVIDAEELAAHMNWTLDTAISIIIIIEAEAGKQSDNDGTISTSGELRKLNTLTEATC